jgi:hypothetical protein
MLLPGYTVKSIFPSHTKKFLSKQVPLQLLCPREHTAPPAVQVKRLGL